MESKFEKENTFELPAGGFLTDGMTKASENNVQRTEEDFRNFISASDLIGDLYSIDYETALIQVHDRFRQLSGGVPAGCLLLATRIVPGLSIDLTHEDSTYILLRVLSAQPLPNEAEAERIRVEVGQRVAGEIGLNWDDAGAMDAVTANLLSYAGLKCRVLGTFYAKRQPETEESLFSIRFGSDLANFYPNRGLKIYKPTGDALRKIVNYSENEYLKEKRRVSIGVVRYASADQMGNRNFPVDVSIAPEDLLAQKTALFGMTRSGKSNTTKIIVKSVFDLRYRKLDARRIGQLIFDANGEYANENVQDASGGRERAAIKNLRDARPEAKKEDVVTYGITTHPADASRKLMLLNFYAEENLQIGKSIIDNALEGDASKFIRNFQQIAFTPPAAGDYSAGVRYRRQVLCYRALLKKAGFAPPIKLEPFGAKLFGKDLIVALEASAGARASDHRQAAAILSAESSSWDQIAHACEYLYDFIVDRTSGYALFEMNYIGRSSSGEAWADDNLKKILEMFRFPNGSRQIGKLVPQHTPLLAGDYAEEIYRDLIAGRLVIVDQSSGDEEINKSNATRLMEHIFRKSQEVFRRGLPPPDILIYLEEAHTILPAGNEADLANIWVRTAKEGGKYRLGLVYATQEVSSIQRNILKNTANFFVAHLNNTDETRELCKFYDFADFESSIRRAQDKGFIRMKTLSNLFVVPIQVNKFEV